jgi:hypothetical protein
MSMVISEVTGWVLTMIIMYQPSIYISIDERVYETATQCMAARAVLLESYKEAKDDPLSHVVIGCHPRMDWEEEE